MNESAMALLLSTRDARPNRVWFAAAYVFLGISMLFVPLPLASVATATGHFEVYCDGVGIFLAKIDGAPVTGKLVLFLPLSFPPGTLGGVFSNRGSGPIFIPLGVECVP